MKSAESKMLGMTMSHFLNRKIDFPLMFFPVACKDLYLSMPRSPILTLGIIMADHIVTWLTLLSEPEAGC